jgi:2-dehydro-3-deoxyphosphogluconate aldolase/(4S)-4-hydroxy-2-oxoglutarate aldolase
MDAETLRVMLGRSSMLAIIRCRADISTLIEIGDALLAAPLPVVAIAPGSRQPWDGLAELRARLGPHLLLGAGLPAIPAQVDAALAAGAQFVLTPRHNPIVAAACATVGAAYLPGVQTPAQLHAAQVGGATGALYFPACRRGADGCAALRAADPNAILIALGGIAPDEFSAYLRAGATAIAIRGVLATKSRWVMADLIRQVRKIRLNLDSLD